MAQPQPEEWFKAYAQVQKKADREILTALRQASADVNADISVQLQREGIGAQVRAEQLQTVKRALLREQATVFRRLGEIVQARRLEAAARAVKLSGQTDNVLFSSVGLKSIAEALSNAIIDGLERTIDSLVARVTGKSYVPLSEKVYKTEAWLSGRVEAGVNSALARGLGPREFAAEARDWINPNTPGGVRYAALRLARTEINNAFHAVSIAANEDKPWVTAVEWHLSGSHSTPDECNVLAEKGPYPKTKVPAKPHPHCFCYITPKAESEEDFLDALVGGKYDDYIESKGLSAAPAEEHRAPAKQEKAPTEKVKPALDWVKDKNKFGDERVTEVLSQQAGLIPNSLRRLNGVIKMTSAEVKKYNADAFYSPDDAVIRLSSFLATPKADKGFQKEKKNGYSARCSHDHALEGTLAHELGHHVEAMVRRAGDRALKELFQGLASDLGLKPPFLFDKTSLDKWVDKNKAVLSKQVSLYGATDSSELMAEMWLEFSTAKDARSHIKAFGEKLQSKAEANSAPDRATSKPNGQLQVGKDVTMQTSDNIERIMNEYEDLGRVGDPGLTEIVKLQGWTTPQVGSSADVSNAVAKGWPEIFRGVQDYKTASGKEINKAMRTDPNFILGTGVYGNGIYFSVDREIADAYAFGKGKAGSDIMRTPTKREGGDVVRAAINPKARMIEYEALLEMVREWYRSPEADEVHQGLRFGIASNPGVFAAMKGYDVIVVDGQVNGYKQKGSKKDSTARQYVVLNRSAMIVEDSDDS